MKQRRNIEDKELKGEEEREWERVHGIECQMACKCYELRAAAVLMALICV